MACLTSSSLSRSTPLHKLGLMFLIWRVDGIVALLKYIREKFDLEWLFNSIANQGFVCMWVVTLFNADTEHSTGCQ